MIRPGLWVEPDFQDHERAWSPGHLHGLRAVACDERGAACGCQVRVADWIELDVRPVQNFLDGSIWTQSRGEYWSQYLSLQGSMPASDQPESLSTILPMFPAPERRRSILSTQPKRPSTLPDLRNRPSRLSAELVSTGRCRSKHR